MASKEMFYIGDNPTLIFECRQPDPYRFDDADGLPANPTSAEYKIYNKTSAETFRVGAVNGVGGQSVFTMADGLIEIEPANEAEDRGAILHVKLPPEFFLVPGSYNLYLTTIFTDDLGEVTGRVTDKYPIDVSEYR